MSRNIHSYCKSSSLRKYLHYVSVIFFVVLTLQVALFYRQHYGKKMDVFVLYNVSKLEIMSDDAAIHITVDDILDHMIHLRHGDFVNNSFKAKLPDFIRNNMYQKSSSGTKEPLTVIVVPHSHNDPGYKKTYSEYFHQFTSHILSLLVEKLYQYSDATFVWPETCFLERWWSNQSKSTRIKFKRLAKSGRLEITSGAWVTADEATPHYFAYLDQMIEGHLWVKQHLGVTPVASFDMDQFGYSSSVRLLLEKAGIKHSVLKRVHLGMKEYLTKMKLMNFCMKTPANFLEKGHFVQVEPYEWLSFPDSCGPNRHVCEDLDFGFNVTLPVLGSSEVNKSIHLLHHHYKNLASFADKIVQQLRLKSNGYQHNAVLLPHGGDFRYSSGLEWDRQYRNMKTLMQYVNSNKKYNVEMRFGTLKDYFTEIEKSSEINHFRYPVFSGDFFPYTTGLGYWSGYFTTRQFLKRLGRELQEAVRAADILAALFILSGNDHGVLRKINPSILGQLVLVRRELSLFQHHDAITGTSSAHVVKDYLNRLTSALSTSHHVMAFYVELILFGNIGNGCTGRNINAKSGEENFRNQSEDQKTCKHVFHVSVKSLSEIGLKEHNENDTYLILYNDLTQERYEIIEFLFSSSDISIQNEQSGTDYSFEYIWRGKLAHIVFETKLPPLSLTSFKISKSHRNVLAKSMNINYSQLTGIELYVCKNSQVNITFSSFDGSPQVMCYRKEDFCEIFNISWWHFTKGGGAYILSTDNHNENLLKSDIKVRKVSGNLRCVVEVSHKLVKVEYILQNTNGVNGRYLQVNIQTDLSRDNVADFIGEVSMRVVTTIKNGDTFYTDSNGLQILKRKFRKAMPFSSNVYPVSSMAAIQDGSRVLNIHTIQPHGVVSWKQGVIDLFVDRVTNQMDGGLSEEVTDNRLTSTKVFLHFEAGQNQNFAHRFDIFKPSIEATLINDLVQHPIKNFYSVKDEPPNKTSIRFLQTALPCDMIIANLKCLTDDAFNLEGVSLTLFRRLSKEGFTIPTNCGLPSKYHFLKPDALFASPRKNITIKEMSLTHLKLKKALGLCEKVKFEEMDLKTFLFV